ncbi:MAG: ATP-dependent sacrificial sulfur transferase LarE [Desulfocapsaceae bacterium]|nr:ATP-dependent sacrificial sulfur transferase LarE [Desulfocapsaceae bacterium]
MSKGEKATPFNKYEKLKHHLRAYESVGVAFSGGVDSSLLLLAAGEALGKERVTAFHGRSVLNSYETTIDDFFAENFKDIAHLKIIDLEPLTWPEFVSNDSKRCYYCKKKTYLSFFEELKRDGLNVLIDGTNVDDFDDDRPGLTVISEFGVKTPLADNLINKKEIRFLARAFGLPNHDLSSNSCLATRVKFAQSIAAEDLQKVKIIEETLKKMEFYGSRARPRGEELIIEIREQDYRIFIQRNNRIEVSKLCASLGFSKVLLDINGRK